METLIETEQEIEAQIAILKFFEKRSRPSRVMNLVLCLEQAVECLEAIARVTTPNQYMMDSINSGNAALQEFLK